MPTALSRSVDVDRDVITARTFTGSRSLRNYTALPNRPAYCIENCINMALNEFGIIIGSIASTLDLDIASTDPDTFLKYTVELAFSYNPDTDATPQVQLFVRPYNKNGIPVLDPGPILTNQREIMSRLLDKNNSGIGELSPMFFEVWERIPPEISTDSEVIDSFAKKAFEFICVHRGL